MKKLLALILVLGMTSSVFAAAVISYDKEEGYNGDTVTVTISSDTAVFGGIDSPLVVSVTNATSFTGELVGTGWGNMPPKVTVGTSSVTFGNGNTAMGAAAGDYIVVTFVLDGTAPTTADVSIAGTIFFDGAHDGKSIDILVPEPMTIALLGLGGLFLRRRKLS